MNSEEKLYHCRQWLSRKYKVEEMTIGEIARLCGVSDKTIWDRLVKFGIKRRRRGPSGVYPMPSAIEKLYYCRQWLRRKYHTETLSLGEIAKECNVSIATIRYFLIKFNIKRRKTGIHYCEKEKLTTIYTRLPEYFFNALIEFSGKMDKSRVSIIKEALTEYLIKKGFNPFKEN